VRWAARYEKDEERFLSAQADTFAGANVKEESSACSVRNDGVVVAARTRGHDVSCPYKSEEADSWRKMVAISFAWLLLGEGFDGGDAGGALRWEEAGGEAHDGHDAGGTGEDREVERLYVEEDGVHGAAGLPGSEQA
jgi:hypothetical protein